MSHFSEAVCRSIFFLHLDQEEEDLNGHSLWDYIIPNEDNKLQELRSNCLIVSEWSSLLYHEGELLLFCYIYNNMCVKQ